MQKLNSAGVQYCPDCGQQLETLWDYPSNEVWCLHCGNRFYRSLSTMDGSEPVIGFRLLILDADTPRRDGLTGRFANLGFHVTPVCHPRQALEAASFRHFDVAILSAAWPGVETSELIAKLRWQLGEVKFVVFDDNVSSVCRELTAHDVQYIRIAPTQASEIESTLEHVVDEMVARNRVQVSATRRHMAHTN